MLLICTWDNLMLATACLAVLARLLDHPQLGGVLGTMTLVFGALGQRAANRARRAALASPAAGSADRPAVGQGAA
jgi:hypothetical protein